MLVSCKKKEKYVQKAAKSSEKSNCAMCIMFNALHSNILDSFMWCILLYPDEKNTLT